MPQLAKAKPKTKVFNAPAERVFEAAHKVAREHHRISYVDEKRMTLQFHTGTSMSSWGFDCNASVEPIGNGKARLTINVQKTEKQLFAWGGGGRTADKFFKWVAEELKEDRTQSTRDTSTDSASETDSQNRQKGTVLVNSEPSKAEIYLDAAFVGNTPATLRLSPGSHRIRLFLKGYEPWGREINVLPDSEVSLHAPLKKSTRIH
jgi:hypothetical protein